LNTADAIQKPITHQAEEHEHWTEIIQPRNSLFDLRLKEVWRYRDLVAMFVRRDFVATYKQTILGPIWFFVQPLLTSLTYIIIFSRVAKLSTDGLPPIVFYLAGITIWNYFSDTLNKTATVFRDNANVFGKVYFPRLTMPVSIVISSLIRFSIQLSLFLGVWIFYLVKGGTAIQPNIYMALVPILIVIMGLLSLGFGMIISALTTKYRDMIMLLAFGVQLLMYATPVIYPVSSIPEKYRWIILGNPVSSIEPATGEWWAALSKESWRRKAITILFCVLHPN
jgi:lipopolysaccharide transport system permease protein